MATKRKEVRVRLVEDSELLKYLSETKSGFVASRENLNEVNDYLTKFSGAEAVVAQTVFWMTLNTIAKMAEEELQPRYVRHAKKGKGRRG